MYAEGLLLSEGGRHLESAQLVILTYNIDVVNLCIIKLLHCLTQFETPFFHKIDAFT